VGAHAVLFRFLLRIVINFAPDMDRLEVPQCLCDLLRSHPRLLPSVLCVERRACSEAVQYKLLHSLGDFVSRLEPPSRIQSYFGLLVTLAETTWLDPSYVMCALRRLVFCPSSTLTWQVGIQVLVTCRRVILSHPQAVIYQPMLRLLHHLATYQACVDLRDRALLYLRLLTHAGSASLGTMFHPNPNDIGQMTKMLTPVLPKTIRLVNGLVPFLRLSKSLDERKKLGIMDRQCAVFVLPAPSESPAAGARTARDEASAIAFDANDWELRWGDNAHDHQFPNEWREFAALVGGTDFSVVMHEQWSEIFLEYRRHVEASPASIRLPFVLEYQKVQKMTSEAFEFFDCPRQLFSLELTFSSSEHFVPIEPIRIPYIAEDRGHAASANAGGFPSMNKLLLRLQPISPVPTSFGVNIAFNDSLGNMYFGQLETFNAAFQDLFLPVRLPLVFWAHLFETLWKGSMEESCWSVKILDLDRQVVQGLIRSHLGPFVVPSGVRLHEEDFDFEQEEYFERWSALEESSSAEIPDVGEVTVNVETVCVIIFIPPFYHLLLRFAISSHSTIVRALTDRFQLLSYMDSFFLSWSRDAAVMADGAVGLDGTVGTAPS
jgi:AP-5 complex subunit beta-1